MGNFIAFSELGKVSISSAKWSGDISKDITRVSMDFSTDMASELSLSISDPDLKILRKQSIPMGSNVTFQNEKMIVAAIATEKGDGTGGLTITCRPRLVHRLKTRKGKYQRTNLSPTSFMKAEVEAVGGKFIGEASPRRKSISRDVKTKGERDSKVNSAWTTGQRLAGDEGFIAFESEGVYYFGRPTWLAARAQKHNVRFGTESGGPDSLYAPEVPICRKSLDDDNIVTVELTLPATRFNSIQVGEVIKLENLGIFTASYLVMGKTYGNGDDIFTVSAETPDNPEKVKR